jgi:hypothetical protein
MDRRVILERLAQAREQVATGERHVECQRTILAGLYRGGRDTTQAHFYRDWLEQLAKKKSDSQIWVRRKAHRRFAPSGMTTLVDAYRRHGSAVLGNAGEDFDTHRGMSTGETIGRPSAASRHRGCSRRTSAPPD